MARALARCRGLEPDSEDDSSASDEYVAEPPPSQQDVQAAGQVIAAWGRRRKSRRKFLKTIGRLDETVGSSEAAIRAHLSPNARKHKPLPLVIVPDVLPTAVAEACLVVLKSLKELAWQSTSSYNDPGDKAHGAGSAQHSFAGCSREDSPLLGPIFEAFDSILPKQVFLGQCSRYQAGDFIEPHDDSAFSLADGVEHSRDIAVILHLTPHLAKSDGGLFVDHAGKSARTPIFNSMVAFRVPRQHEVTQVIARVQRYSIFGWFMEPGRLYNLQHSGSHGQNKKVKRQCVIQPTQCKKPVQHSLSQSPHQTAVNSPHTQHSRKRARRGSSCLA